MQDFVFLFRSSADNQEQAIGTPERAQKSLETWLGWIRELESKGQLKHPGQPLAREGRVVRGPDKLVTDGPYAEAKDLILGFLVIAARDLDHATEIAGGCPIVLGGGAVEIRPVMAIAL
jgi:hypothetical protein